MSPGCMKRALGIIITLALGAFVLTTATARPGVMPTAMRVAGFVFDTIAQYSPKKPRTGLGQFSGEFLLGSLEWASVLRT
jgi:hypothetical protein